MDSFDKDGVHVYTFSLKYVHVHLVSICHNLEGPIFYSFFSDFSPSCESA